MYKIFTRCFRVLVASFSVRLSSALSSSLESNQLSTQCLPEDVSLFNDLACSSSGPSFVLHSQKAQDTRSQDLHPIQQIESASWSYVPQCSEATGQDDNEICVYTNTKFANGRGVSIITIPPIAERFAALQSFQEPAALDGLLLTGNVRVTPKTSLKGRTATAKHNLQSMDMVAANVPILVESLESNVLSWREREELLRVAIKQLPTATQRLLVGLTSKYEPELLISGYIDSHGGFPVNIAGYNHSALFPELSYFNHACTPKSVLEILTV